MSRPAKKSLIGGFVLGAMALAVAGVVILGSGRFFSETSEGVLYFDGSVKGLSVGAPVIFRGVKIGSVTGISLRFDPASMQIQIPVFIQTQKERIEKSGHEVRDAAKILSGLIDKGLRGRLESQSFVTGQLMIALDFYPDEPARFAGDGSILEIPTIPSSMEQLTRTLENLPLEDLVNRATSAVTGLDRLLNAPELQESIASLNQDLKDIQKLLKDVDAQFIPIGAAVQDAVKDAQNLVRSMEGQIGPIGSSLQKTLEDTRKLVRDVNKGVDPLYAEIMEVIRQANGAIKKAESTIAGLENGTEESSTLMVGLVDSFSEFEKAARAVRGLAEYLEKNPEALLRGKGPLRGK